VKFLTTSRSLRPSSQVVKPTNSVEYKERSENDVAMLTKDVEKVKGENSTFRSELNQNLGQNEEDQLNDKAQLESLINKFNRFEEQTTDQIGIFDEKINRDIKSGTELPNSIDIEELTEKMTQMEQKTAADFKNKDVSLRSLLSNMEEQSDAMTKLKKDVNKKLEVRNQSEDAEELRIELTKGELILLKP